MKLINIRKTYYNRRNKVEALKDIDLDFDKKGLIVILGSSGCGKTTLLNILSGDDTSFEGERIDVPTISYLTQEIHLFESMTIYENLRVVSDELQIIEDYLKKYRLWEHKDKKVKKCSNGQKKRVQFLRALLQKPGLLLCDEPTAALDHDNAESLMEDLKEVSTDIQVIIVTHDIALSEKYADRIIRMGKGIIESDEIIHETDKTINNHKIEKKSVKDTFSLVVKELKSRAIENILFIMIITMSITAIFSTFSLYYTIEEQTDMMDIFRKAKNVIYSYPKNPTKYEEWEGKYYVDFDLYYYKDIVNVIESYPEIIAVEAFFDDDTYLKSVQVDSFHNRVASTTFKDVDFAKYDNNSIYVSNNIPYDSAFFIDEDLKKSMNLYEEEQRINRNNKTEYYIDFEAIIDEYGFSFFDLLDVDAIPILYGYLPKNSNEIIISKDTADLLMNYIGYSSYEEIISTQITVGVYGRANFLAHNQMIDYYFDDENAHVREMIELTITGISNIENKYFNMVFFNSEFAKNEITSHFVKDYEHLCFDYVRFIVKPDTNMEKFLDKINKSFSNEKSEFYLYNSFNETLPSYRDITNLIIFGISIIVMFVGCIIVYYLFIRRRFLKEQRILKEYHYSVYLEGMIRRFIVHTIALIVLFVFGQPICDMVNQFAISMYYEKFLNMDYKFIILAYVIIFLFSIICEKMIGVKKK